MTVSDNRVLAVVVTYNPGPEVIENLRQLQEQVSKVLVVDNSPTSNFWDYLKSLQEKLSFELLVNGENLGIAGALNRGVQYAFDQGYKWVLTMDQDSVIPSQYVESFLKTYHLSDEKEKIGILAPTHFDKKTGYQSKDYRGLQGPYVCKDIVMTSGNLIPIHIFEQVGLYDEDLFIEYVDHDFCLRVKKAGFKTVLVTGLQIAHSLGEIRLHPVLGTWFFFSHNYHPVRRYYRARNRLVLYVRHFGLWILQDQEFAIKDMAKILLVEDLKWQKIKATLSGSIDAIRMRMGCYNNRKLMSPRINGRLPWQLQNRKQSDQKELSQERTTRVFQKSGI